MNPPTTRCHMTINHVFGEGWYIGVFKDGQEIKRQGPYKTKPSQLKLSRIQFDDFSGETCDVVWEND